MRAGRRWMDVVTATRADTPLIGALSRSGFPDPGGWAAGQAGGFANHAASDAFRTFVESVTRWVLDTLGGDAAQVRWVLEVHEGGAGPVLVAKAHGARMLVVGTHEHTGLREFGFQQGNRV